MAFESAPPLDNIRGVFSGTQSNGRVRAGVSYRLRASLLIIPLLAGLMAGSAAISSASVTTAHTSPTAKGLAFYQGKTITLITGGAPGAFIYTWAQILAPVMGTYLHAKINIEDVSSGGSVGSENDIAAAVPNGLTFGWMNLGAAVDLYASGLPGLNFNVAALPYAGGVNMGATVFIANPNSPYKSFTDVLRATGVPTLDLVSGNTDLALRATYGAYGAKEDIVTGYSSVPLLLAGFLRGDGPVTLMSLSTADPSIVAHQAIPLFKTIDVPETDPAASELKGVPTLAKYISENPPKTKSGKIVMAEVNQVLRLPDAFAFPKGTSQSYVDAMGAAMTWALSRRVVKKQALADSLINGSVSGPQAHLDLLNALRGDSVVKPYLLP
jgi:hypothetical protein